MVLAAAVVALSGCSSSGPAPDPVKLKAALRAVNADGSPATFLVFASLAYGQELQLRSSTTGLLVSSLGSWSGVSSISASRVNDHEVVVAAGRDCRTQLDRIDLATGQRTALPDIDQQVYALAISPDGTTAAYVTTVPCNPDDPAPAGQTIAAGPAAQNPHLAAEPALAGGLVAGAARFLPSILVVAPLAGGRAMSTRTDTPGHPLGSPVWSLDGTHLALDYSGDTNQILTMSADHPSFATAARLAAPTGCSYFSPTWTRDGLLVTKSCHDHSNTSGVGSGPNTLSPSALVQLSTTGTPTHTWALPDCINGINGITDTTRTHVLLDLNIGYGDCATTWTHRIAALTPTGMRTITDTDAKTTGPTQLALW